MDVGHECNDLDEDVHELQAKVDCVDLDKDVHELRAKVDEVQVVSVAVEVD